MKHKQIAIHFNGKNIEVNDQSLLSDIEKVLFLFRKKSLEGVAVCPALRVDIDLLIGPEQ